MGLPAYLSRSFVLKAKNLALMDFLAFRSLSQCYAPKARFFRMMERA